MDMEKQELPRTSASHGGSLQEDIGDDIPRATGAAAEEINHLPTKRVSQEIVLVWDGLDDPGNRRN